MKFICISLSLFLLISCNDRPADTTNKAFQEELKDRQIMHISDGEIIDAAMKRGNAIADSAQKVLGMTLKKSISENGVKESLNFCNLNAYPILEKISKENNVEIRRASLRLRNQNDAPNDLEKQLLEAYDYQVQNEDKLSANIQRDGDNDEYLLYTRPIVIKDAMCLKCHGEVGKYLEMEDFEQIRSLYPNDNATGHKMGDLRGMWSIKFSKKDIVKNL